MIGRHCLMKSVYCVYCVGGELRAAGDRDEGPVGGGGGARGALGPLAAARALRLSRRTRRPHRRPLRAQPAPRARARYVHALLSLWSKTPLFWAIFNLNHLLIKYEFDWDNTRLIPPLLPTHRVSCVVRIYSGQFYWDS
jgi:hypothetical protein